MSDLHRTATTKHPCFGQDLGDSMGAGRVGLTRCKVKHFFSFCNIFLFFLFFCFSFCRFCKKKNRLSDGVPGVISSGFPKVFTNS